MTKNDWFHLQKIERENLSFSSKFFLDANVWLKLNSPYPARREDPLPHRYSKILKKIFDNKGQVFIDSTIISEYYNRFVRIVHEARKSDANVPAEWKQFRSTEDCRECARAACGNLKTMISKSTLASFAPSTEELNEMMDKFDVSTSDINDEIIKSLCNRHGFILVTHDKDFREKDVQVLSCNASYAAN